MKTAIQNNSGGFEVFTLENFFKTNNKTVACEKKDFYKIILIKGKNNINYADKIITIHEQAVLFVNPNIPYTREQIDTMQTGYVCLFKKEFFSLYGQMEQYHPFQPGGNPIINITKDQNSQFENLFLKMIEQINSEYTFKNDVLRNLVFDIIELCLKTQPEKRVYYNCKSNATSRISSFFIELLDRQFPLESPRHKIALRYPSEYANQLNIDVTHLNKAMKKATGKTTSQLISERLLKESKNLLQNSSWNLNDIGWSLGFEELSSFTHFFRKEIQFSPKAFRELVMH